MEMLKLYSDKELSELKRLAEETRNGKYLRLIKKEINRRNSEL